MNDIIHIATTIDKNYIQHLGVMLCSLFEHNKDNKFLIHILIDFDENELRTLKAFVKKYNQTISIIFLDNSILGNVKLSGHISKATYYRLVMPEYLIGQTEKVLYLDSDLIIKSNILPLWHTQLDNFPVAAVNDGTEGNDFFNAGVLLININYWVANNFTKRCLEYAYTNHDKIIFWDQDVLNAILRTQWKPLPEIWNITSGYFDETIPNDIRFSDINIIHFTGSHKPWHFHCNHPLKLEYFKYLRKTPWKNFKIKEDSPFHRFKQILKKSLNLIVGKKKYKIYS